MSDKIITQPAEEPLTLAEIKLHLRIDAADEDAWLTSRIVAARQQAEHETGRVLITQTWELALDEFPAAEVRLPKAPLQSITSVKYYDPTGVQQTMSGALYSADLYSTLGWLLPAYGTAWPATMVTANAVIVRYVAGYGAAAAVPQGIKDWMLMRVGTAYRYREELVEGRMAPMPYADHALDPFRVIEFV